MSVYAGEQTSESVLRYEFFSCNELASYARLEFFTVENFRAFCALGDVDPDKGVTSYNGHGISEKRLYYIFASRTRDIVFETYTNNPAADDPYAHYFGITGRKDKLRVMFEFAKRECEGWLEWGYRSFT